MKNPVPATPVPDEIPDLSLYRVVFTVKELDEVTVDEFIRLTEGNFQTLRAVLARNVRDKKTDELVDAQTGNRVIGALKFRQLKELMTQIKDAAQAVAPEM